jgi:hypothetical protein
MGRVCSMYGDKRNAYRILVGKLEGLRPLRKWEDTIKVELREIRWGGTDWIHLS